MPREAVQGARERARSRLKDLGQRIRAGPAARASRQPADPEAKAAFRLAVWRRRMMQYSARDGVKPAPGASPPRRHQLELWMAPSAPVLSVLRSILAASLWKHRIGGAGSRTT
jgi:hypothetical protein